MLTVSVWLVQIELPKKKAKDNLVQVPIVGKKILR